ncbi:MAG: hypothetical protein GY847_41725 [Proteobacteria bacterium]|nr:hypothetical protein [Pseudomonadota bacterium]
MIRGDEGITVTIITRFADPVGAETARSTIEEMLNCAEKEVDELFVRQGGIAEVADISNIYARFGFQNDIGWRHETPIISSGDELIWELPEGLILEEAQVLLLALGAQAIAVQVNEEEEQWRQALHPIAMLFLEEDRDFLEHEDEESIRPSSSIIKKILH